MERIDMYDVQTFSMRWFVLTRAALRFFSLLFGWTFMMLIMSFKLPELLVTPVATVLWMVFAIFVVIIYSLSSVYVVKRTWRCVVILTSQMLCIVILFLITGNFYYYLSSAPLKILGDMSVGDAKIWYGVFVAMLILGSISGPILVCLDLIKSVGGLRRTRC